MKLTEEDIWINEDFSNDHEEFVHKQQYVFCAQLPWVGTSEEAQSMKQQILENQEIVEKIQGWLKDLDAQPEHNINSKGIRNYLRKITTTKDEKSQ